MALGGEVAPSFGTIAELAHDAPLTEAHAPDPERLIYVIGTDVPIPGGETEQPDAPDVASVARPCDTIETHRAAFAARGLDDAWGRIASVVTQPGVGFGPSQVCDVAPDAAVPPARAILAEDGLTFEAHSTDYQRTNALGELVDAHWRDYYRGAPEEVAVQRLFSYSGRVRYYWTDREVATALGAMLVNLRATALPETVVSQHFPGLDFGAIPTDPDTLI